MAHLTVHACAGKKSPCCRDSVPNRCTLVRAGEGKTHPIPCKTCLHLPTIEPARNSLASAGMSLASTGNSPAFVGMSPASTGNSPAFVGMSVA